MVTEWSVPGILTSAAGVQQLDLRTHDLAPRRFGSMTTSVDRPVTSSTLLGDGDAFLDVLELRLAGELGDDRAGQRVPVGQHGAGLDLLVGLDRQQRPPYGTLDARARGRAGRR